ncbi:sensor histidine kinase [Marinospirillum alkaliphilum]|uniref:histidine kinase n=1 Tax=Marinospirillum alkaliphilum DSM 21637 TaxID=1122209 RepID=A0A1K1Z5K1_9GAMM|nr:sensor histidine kinase [Marinospirillum alkaliphilum]SFX69449.1 PAS domain S-box-containing protein [Marinospirillum alkaliphilum DSM 21637]
MNRLLMPLLLGCWLLVSALLWVGWNQSVRSFETTSLQQMESHTHSLAEIQKTLVQLKLQEIERILVALETLAASTQMDRKQLEQAMRARKQPSPEILAFILLNHQGELQAFSLPELNPELSDRDYFVWHKDNPDSGRSYISPPLYSRSNDAVLFVAISRALHNQDGEFIGVLAAAIDLEQLASELGKLTEDGSHATVLSDLNGRIFFRMPWLPESTGLQSGVLASHVGELGSMHATRITSPFDGQSRQLSYGRIPDWPVVVYVSEDLSATELQIRTHRQIETQRALLALAFFSLLMGSLLLLLRRYQTNQVHLQQSEERFRLAQDAAQLGVWDLDLQSGELKWDNQIWKQLGYDKPAFPLSMQAWLDTIHPEDLPQVQQLLEASLRSRKPFLLEFRCQTASGQWQWQQGRGQVVSWDLQGHPLRLTGTSLNIHEYREAQQQLAERTEALQRSNADLEQFAYVVSHDLRQPLRMIRSYVELLEKRLQNQLDGDSRLFMHYITDGAARMDQMLVSLLEYSRIGRMGEPKALTPSRQLLDEALTFLQPEIQETQAEIICPEAWPDIYISRNEGIRLFQNLMGNAIKYRQPEQQPKIQIEITEQTNHWLFCIRDNGIGIAPDQQDRLFKVFQRLHARSEYEGTGIGLAICRRIVERHGGRIWVESAGANQGSAFCFTLAREEQPLA